MSGTRYDQTKRQAKTCRNLNPEQKNMATLYQIRIQNQRENKQLQTRYKGLEEEQKILSAEHARERESLKRELYRLQQVHAYGRARSNSTGGHGSLRDSTAQFDRSRSGSYDRGRSGSYDRGRSGSYDRGNFSNRDARALSFKGNRHMRQISFDEQEGSSSSRQEKERQLQKEKLQQLGKKTSVLTKLTGVLEGNVSEEDAKQSERWKRLNMLVNGFDGKMENLSRLGQSIHELSLSDAQDQSAQNRRDQAFGGEAFGAEDAFKVLNTRYLRLTKMNVDQMEHICHDEGMDVSSLHTHVDAAKTEEELLATFRKLRKNKQKAKVEL